MSRFKFFLIYRAVFHVKVVIYLKKKKKINCYHEATSFTVQFVYTSLKRECTCADIKIILTYKILYITYNNNKNLYTVNYIGLKVSFFRY